MSGDAGRASSGSRVRSRLARAFAGVVLAWAAFVVGWFLARTAWPDAWWPLVLLDKLGLYLFFPLPLALAGSLLVRRWRPFAASVAVLAVFLVFHGPLLLPGAVPTDGTRDVRVLTYNLWNRNRDVAAMARLIERTEADLVAIQELVPEVEPALLAALAARYPHRHVARERYGGTTALFSRHPLTDVRELDFGIDRPAILADLELDGRALTFVSAHLIPSWFAYNERPVAEMPRAIERYIVEQNDQARQLIAALGEKRPILLACDCNSQYTASTNPILERFLDDAARTLGWTRGDVPLAGARHDRDLGRIDYVWHRGALRPLGLYRLDDAGGSDHEPVVADFAFGEPRP